MGGPVDGAPPPSPGGPVERGGHGLFHRHHDEEPRRVVEYDLSDWTDDQVAALSAELQIAHLWYEWRLGTLFVEGEHEAMVDELVDAIDGLDEAPDDVQYEFPDWTPQQRQQLVDRLLGVDIACVWDGYLLSVGAADEATVDAEVLKIDPTFPVNDSDDDDDDDEQPDLGIPEESLVDRIADSPWTKLLGGLP